MMSRQASDAQRWPKVGRPHHEARKILASDTCPLSSSSNNAVNVIFFRCPKRRHDVPQGWVSATNG
jgi:hypothetical protein